MDHFRLSTSSQRAYLLSLLFLFSIQFLFAKPETHKIKIKIEGAQDTVVYLAHYYGDKTYIDDTAKVSKKGEFVFEADSILPEGMYIVAGQENNRYFEFILDQHQDFSILTDKKKYP